MGHLAMGLLWAIPAWFIWDGRVSLAFIGFAFVAALLPDVDIWLSALAPSAVHHHGVTHTVVFVVGVAVVAGAIIAAVGTRPLDKWLGSEKFDRGSLFVFSAGAITVGGLSHLFADILSAPDVASPIEPFWPFFDEPLIVDVIWYNSPWWNSGLLIVAVLLHIAIGYASRPVDHSYRLT